VSGIGRIVIGCDDLGGFPSYADKIRLSLPPRGNRSPGEGDDEEIPVPDEDPGEPPGPPTGPETPAPESPTGDPGPSPPSPAGID
jgi:hypothetical protein